MGEACGTYGEKGNEYMVWWGILKELDNFKYQDADMRMILKCILKRQDGRTDRIHLAHHSEKWLSTANTAINLQIPYRTRSLLNSSESNSS
jgi:hypothetical protein